MSLNLKAHCCEMLAFHQWRQSRITGLLRSMDISLFDQKLSGSFGSLFIVLNHLVWAEKVWYGRVDNTGVANMTDLGPEGLMRAWEETTNRWISYLNTAPAELFERNITYYNTQGDKFENTLFEIVTHMVDHSTYHIGQMMNAVRSFGIEPVSTNYIHYIRDKRKK